jgi:hypothetical protein
MATTRFAVQEGIWLKGNVHAHSTQSDGKLTATELLEGYANEGYDFISITDHDLYATYTHPTLLCIPGAEASGFFADKPIHINLLQIGETLLFEEGHRFTVKDEKETRSLIERCQEEYLIVLNHPAWSLLNFEDIASVEGLSGIEVSNYSTEALNGVEGSVHLWESGLRRGKRWLAFGGDDNHNGFASATGWPFSNAERDSFGSWIMANAAERSQPALMEALSLGNFYTTEGPEIHSFAVIDGSVHVRCSPVNRIIIKGERRNFVRRLGEGMTELVAPLNGESRFVRLECTDGEGRSAYSNPIWLA